MRTEGRSDGGCGAWGIGTGRRRVLGTATGLSLAAVIGRAQAQASFPSRPIEVVVHTSAGGGTDITSRTMATDARAVFGTNFTVLNRTGGNGAVALAYAAGRPKDGHTILLVTQSHLLTMIRNRTPTQYEDLVPVARATDDPQVVIVRRDSSITSVEELLAAGRSRALRISITNAGGTDHITVVGFSRAAGFQPPIVVPFRGGGDIVLNLVGGNIDVATLNYAEFESHLRSGDIRTLLALSDQRLSVLPDLPTAKEVDIPATYGTVRGFCVLKGTPEDRIARLEEGILRAMQGETYRNYLTTSGQPLEGIAGRAVWKAQLDAIQANSREMMEFMGLLR